MDLFISDTYVAVTWEDDVAVGCILVYMCNKVRSVCSFNMLAYMSAIVAVWELYLFVQLYVTSMCTVLLVTWLIPVISYVTHICVYIFH